MPQGVIRKVPGGVHWEVILESQLIDWGYWSPNFTCKGITCRFYLVADSDITDFVCVRFIIIHVPEVEDLPRLLRWHMSVKRGDGLGLPCLLKGAITLKGMDSGQARFAVIERAKLERLLSSGGRLTIVFRMDVEGNSNMQRDDQLIGKPQVSRETQTEDGSAVTIANEGYLADEKSISTLQKHFKDLLLSGDDHDVIIKIKSREFKAHRSVLRARSPVFAAMFKNEMKERTDGTIRIEDCDPETFDEFLEYVYTGKVQNLSTDKAMGLYYAGDKYDFPGLKEACVEFLKTSFSTMTVSGVVCLAINHGEHELLQSTMTFFAEHFEEIMVTVEWQRFLMANPIQANEICLKAMKSRLHGK